MSHISIKALMRDHGVSREDIALAKATREAQKRADAPVQSLAEICGVQTPRTRRGGPVQAGQAGGTVDTSLEARQLRKRGTYDQAALQLDRAALAERSPKRAILARQAARIAKDLSASQQLEFDFFGGGNVSIAHQYHDAITERLFAEAGSTSEAMRAQAVLSHIIRHLGWQNYECTKTAAQLCDLTRTKRPNMATTLALLERVGAITRIRRGRVKIITVTPEGAFRGEVKNHAKTVERYRLDVIEGGREEPAPVTELRPEPKPEPGPTGMLDRTELARRLEAFTALVRAGNATANDAELEPICQRMADLLGDLDEDTMLKLADALPADCVASEEEEADPEQIDVEEYIAKCERRVRTGDHDPPET